MRLKVNNCTVIDIDVFDLNPMICNDEAYIELFVKGKGYKGMYYTGEQNDTYYDYVLGSINLGNMCWECMVSKTEEISKSMLENGYIDLSTYEFELY